MRSHDDCINLSGPTPAWRGRRFQVRHWCRSSLRRGGDCVVTNDGSLMSTADALDARRRYLAFRETRAESLGHKDAEPADRARDLDDLKGAVAAARALLSGTRAAIVMVVDDQIAIHQLARRILEPEGYMVVRRRMRRLRCWLCAPPPHMSCCATCTCLVRQDCGWRNASAIPTRLPPS